MSSRAPKGSGWHLPPYSLRMMKDALPPWKDALESPGKIVLGKQILLTSGSPVTSQVRSKSKCLTFRLGDIGEQNFYVKLKQSQRIGMDSVSDICKHHFLCFVTII